MRHGTLAQLLAALCACLSLSAQTLSSDLIEGAYYWGVGDPEAIHGADVMFLAGEGEWKEGQLVFGGYSWPRRLSTDASSIAVFRLSTPVLLKLLTKPDPEAILSRSIDHRLAFFEERYGCRPQIQIDADCPTSKLDPYVALITGLKQLQPDLTGVTIIASWLLEKKLLQIQDLGIDLYAMLYTMAPSVELGKWGGEVPPRIWGHSKQWFTRGPLDQDRVVLALPCYTIVTVYDPSDSRVWRGADLSWLTDDNASLLPIDPPNGVSNQVGSTEAWRVIRSGLFGGRVLEAGTTIIRERFSLDDWYEAASDLEDVSPKICRYAIYHVGNLPQSIVLTAKGENP